MTAAARGLGEPFLGWTEPAAVFVLTGQQHGYLEPCGCSERQSGGMARRADLLRQIREVKGWPVTALDVGGSLLESRASRLQSALKFDAILKGLDSLKYQTLQLGLEEMMLGPEKLYTADQNLEAASGDERKLPFLAANVMLLSDDLGTPLKWRLLEVGSVKVAVTGVIGQSMKGRLHTMGALNETEFVRVDDPVESLNAVLPEIRAAEPDLLVLMSHADVSETQSLIRAVPGFHLVVTAGGAEDPPREPEWIDQSMLVQVGQKGKSAPVVGYFPQAEKPLRLELLELDMGRFENHPSMIELMRDYQQQLEANFDEIIEDLTIADGNASFVGVDECKTCHSHAYRVWSNTKHAHALDSLATGRPGQEANWVPRLHDPECLACHSTGWDPQEALRFASGFISRPATPHLAGNQCENCHGPGSEHVKFELSFKQNGQLTAELLAARRVMDIDLPTARDKVCIRCHDHENSPTFNFDERWPKVMHSGKKD